MTTRVTLKSVHAHLARAGLLLLADNTWPSLVTMVVGGAVQGSWWGHAEGNRIYNLAGALDDYEDVLSLKLVGGKITFVHATLWPALLALATSKAA